MSRKYETVRCRRCGAMRSARKSSVVENVRDDITKPIGGVIMCRSCELKFLRGERVRLTNLFNASQVTIREMDQVCETYRRELRKQGART